MGVWSSGWLFALGAGLSARVSTLMAPTPALLAMCAWLLMGTPALGQTQTAAVPSTAAVVLERLPHGLHLQGRVALLADPTGALTLEQVRQPVHAASWLYPVQLLRAHGPTVWWLRIRVAQPSPGGHWLLELPTTALRDVTFYGPLTPAGERLAGPLTTGLIHPFASRVLGSERAVFPVALPQPGTYTLYLRVQSSIPQYMTPTLWDADDYHLSRQHQRLFDGVIYGMLLTLLAAMVALHLALRDPVLLAFGFMTAFAGLSLLSFNGHAAQYLWPANPWWIEHSYVIFPALWLAACAAFARSFLHIQGKHRLANGFFLGFVFLCALALLLGVLGYTVWAQHLNEAVALSGSVCLTLIAARQWQQGYLPARWYLAGSLLPFMAVGTVVAVNWGWSEQLFWLYNSLEIGIVAQSLVFAAALSARIRFVQQQNTQLEQRSLHLAKAALTDTLTGLYNRSGLDEIGNALLRRPGTHALVLFDLDRFKPINDTLGHEAGDQVLREIGLRLRLHTRERDLAVRLGGDEFVLLLAQCPARPELDAMVERLRLELDAPINYGAQRLQVSASAGVALTPHDGSELYGLLRAADLAMYSAKAGRKGQVFAADAPAMPERTTLAQPA
jgi:diguanylate cyclase (GGDEF)-like protein